MEKIKRSDVIENKIKFQSKVNFIVIAQIENSQAKIEKRISSRTRVVSKLSGITNFKMIMMFVFNVISTDNSKPNQGNTHNSK